MCDASCTQLLQLELCRIGGGGGGYQTLMNDGIIVYNS